MKKLIIRTRNQDLTPAMLEFGNDCANTFIKAKALNTYGDDWCSCIYTFKSKGLSCLVELRKSGTLSVLVISEVVRPCD